MPISKAKADARTTEKAAFTRRVEATLDHARAAARSAYQAYAETAPRTGTGALADSCGGASVIVYKPSYRLRETLKALDAIQSNANGALYLSGLSRDVNTQSVTAHEKACNAAAETLAGELPDDGEYDVRSYID